MPKRSRSNKRALTKRVTSIDFYVDQATQIQTIMEATETTMEAIGSMIEVYKLLKPVTRPHQNTRRSPVTFYTQVG